MVTHVCPHCSVEQDASKYQLAKGRPGGWCRSCRTDAERKRRRAVGMKPRVLSAVTNVSKQCMECNEIKALYEFSPSVRGSAGVSSYCYECRNVKYYDKEAARLATARYRTRHKERHLTMHRVRMFERNHNKRVSDDGTVTEEFLRCLYATHCCHYCFLFTPAEARTADHKTALIRGGRHSASNLVMACRTCNSSKRDLSEKEFRAKLLHNFDIETYLKHHSHLSQGTICNSKPSTVVSAKSR